MTLLNGETGTYSYYDDLYDGFGDNTVSLEPLYGGLGDLTDGIMATQHWNANNVPYMWDGGASSRPLPSISTDRSRSKR